MNNIKIGNFVRVGKKTNPREAKIIKLDNKISCDNIIIDIFLKKCYN